MKCGRMGVALAMTAGLVLPAGCGNSANTSKVESTAVAALVARLANLKPFGIASCRFTVETTTVDAWLPAPSDTKLVLIGSAELSEEGAKAIRLRFAWKPIARCDVPGSLSAILPAGAIVSSQEFNETFDTNNGTFKHGIVILPARPESRSLFFVSHDEDHPIKWK